MKFELMLAARHLLSRRGKRLSLVGMLAVTGVAIGVAALIGGASITAGFERAFQDKLLGVTAHLFARPYSSTRYPVDEIEDAIKASVPSVQGVSPTTYHKAIFVAGGGTVGGFVKSIQPERARATLKLHEYLVKGDLDSLIPSPEQASLKSYPTPIVIGEQLARRLNVNMGQLMTGLTGVSSQRGRRQESSSASWSGQDRGPQNIIFRVVGVFRAGYDEYDARFAFIYTDEATKIFGRHDSVQGFEISIKDPQKATELAPKIGAAMKWGLGDPIDWAEAVVTDPLKATRIATRASETFSVQGWYEQNPTLYMSLLYQRLAILIVLSVMLILASCNVSSMLMMMTLERTPEIAILKTMGASNKNIRRIFHIEGIGIAAMGSLIGVMIGFMFCEWLLVSGLQLDPQVYGIDRFPVEFRWSDCVLAVLGSMVILSIAVSIPARRGSNLPPTDGLRCDQLDLPR